ncbi:MAG TPA: tRNA lysidine(34) synthetase TilS [Thermomicrobiales bacterium]|nr:tRNA lysidine(34) synthetase TilS [Thermomicrobiales bacterium]
MNGETPDYLSALPAICDLAAAHLRWERPVAIACSGGVDSTALLLLSASVREAGIAPFVVVHVDHRTRENSAAEGALVAGLSAKLGIPFVRSAVVANWREGDHVSEHQLRRARFDALGRVVTSLGLDAVVTAHTQDDQVETILMRILGGAAPTGASGMRAESTIGTAAGPLRILRPLLDVSRRELVAVLDAAGVEPAHDPSNADPRYRRSVLRSEIVPALRREFPGFPTTLLRSVSLARLDGEVVDAVAAEAYGRIACDTAAGVALARAIFRDLPRAVASRVVVSAARQVSSTMDADWRELTTERIGAVVDAARGRTGALIQLPYGVDVRVERDVLLFVPRSAGDRE